MLTAQHGPERPCCVPFCVTSPSADWCSIGVLFTTVHVGKKQQKTLSVSGEHRLITTCRTDSSEEGACEHLLQTWMSSHLVPHPLCSTVSPPFPAKGTGRAEVVPGCDPGSDSGAWTVHHGAQLPHQRKARRLGVD